MGPEAVLNASWAGEGLAARPRIYVYELPPRFNAWLLYHQCALTCAYPRTRFRTTLRRLTQHTELTERSV